MKMTIKKALGSIVLLTICLPGIAVPGVSAQSIEEINPEDYSVVSEHILLNNELVDQQVDFTEIPRYKIESVESKDYISAVESYFDSKAPSIIMEEVQPDNSMIVAKRLEDSKGSYSLNTYYDKNMQSFIAIQDYALFEDFQDFGMVNNLLYFPDYYGDIVELSDEELSFSSQEESINLVEDYVTQVYKYPNIKVNKIKSLKADQFQNYVDEQNLNKLKENESDWIIEPRDVYLIDFSVAFGEIPVVGANLQLPNNEIHGTTGSAIISENGLEVLSIGVTVMAGEALTPLESTVKTEAIYPAIYQHVQQEFSGLDDLQNKDLYITDLSVVYIPYYVGGLEMSFAPAWQVHVEIPVNNVNDKQETEQGYLPVDILIDPVSGESIARSGA